MGGDEEEDEEEFVVRAVHLQRTSPNFAEFCITHVTNKRYQFLFSQTDTPQRRLYLRLLDKARASQDVNSERSATRQKELFALGQNTAHGVISLRDVRAMWEACHLLVHPERGVARGPHTPHMFASIEKLSDFVAEVLRAAHHQKKEEVNASVQFQVSRATMTECFLVVHTYLIDELLYLHRQRKVRSVALCQRRVEEEETEPAASSVDGAVAGGDDTSYVEAAATIFFMVAALIALHRSQNAVWMQYESSMEEPAHPSPAVLYYQEAFEYYCLCMLEGFAHYIRRATDSAAAATESGIVYVGETVDAWLADPWMSPATSESFKILRAQLTGGGV